MASFRHENQKLFPLKSISDIVNFFRHHLESDHEPDLTLLSIVTGIFENTLTSSPEHQNQTTTVELFSNFPVVQYETVDILYKKFQTILTSAEIKQKTKPTYATREIIKKISDIIWNSLARSSYKDRAHLQSLYSYLTGNKLDCFGVAFAVVAGCQTLGFNDPHLAMSEDHVWVVFGKNGDETIEVTWHGKGSEDKRGQPVSSGIDSHSWLYVAGYPVVCNRYMEVAALVSAINPTLNITSTCQEVEELQKQLLWLLYDLGHLAKYPMALGTLGELEEATPTVDRASCEELFAKAVKSAKEIYKNHHVYPYTFQGCYYSRKKMYREAFASFANAGDVIRLYNYSRDDEEIYKEFLEIANESIPQIMKLESSGHSAKSILRDSHCFANLLRFYDGICQWEEGSLTPILHIGWAKPLVSTISKFDYDIRSQVIINCENNDDDDNNPHHLHHPHHINHNNHHQQQQNKIQSIINNDSENINELKKNIDHNLDNTKINTIITNNNNNNIITTKLDNIINDSTKKEAKDTLISTLEALTAACGEKILNPDFLLQGHHCPPFAELLTTTTPPPPTNTQQNNDNLIDGETSTIKLVDEKFENIVQKYETTTFNKEKVGISDNLTNTTTPKMELLNVENNLNNTLDDDNDIGPKRPIITLYSHKMKGLKDLLLSERLNTHAISLQVTAQSQVSSSKKGRFHLNFSGSGNFTNDMEGSTRPKRNRRE